MESTPLYVFIDNSNIFINAKKYSAKFLGFPTDEDPCCRIDVGKLLTMIVHGNGESRRIADCSLYGSEPPPVDTFWKKVVEFNIKLQKYKRSKTTGKEKQIDTKLVSNATKTILKNENHKGVIVIFSGDEDMIPILDVAKEEEGWNIEVWSFKSSLSPHFQDRSFSAITKILHLEDKFQDFTYRELFWRQKPPTDSPYQPPENLQRFLSQLAARITSLLKLPSQACFLAGGTTSVIVMYFSDAYLRDKLHLSTPYLFENITPLITQHFMKVGEVATYHQYIFRSKVLNSVPKTFRDNNPYDVLRNDDEQEVDVDEDEVIAIGQASTAISTPAVIQPVFQPIQTMPQPHWGQPPWSQPVLPLVSTNHDFMQSYLYTQGFQDLNQITEHEFNLVRRFQPKQTLRYTSQCPYEFTCRKGKHCDHLHTIEEKEYFTVRRGLPDKYHLYKTALCKAFQDNVQCHYAQKSYLCGYAHGLKERRCKICLQFGHDFEKCPDKKF